MWCNFICFFPDLGHTFEYNIKTRKNEKPNSIPKQIAIVKS